MGGYPIAAYAFGRRNDHISRGNGRTAKAFSLLHRARWMNVTYKNSDVSMAAFMSILPKVFIHGNEQVFCFPCFQCTIMLRRDKSGKGGAGGEITLLLCWALSLTERVRLHLIKMQGCYVFLYIANITYRMNDDQHARVNT